MIIPSTNTNSIQGIKSEREINGVNKYKTNLASSVGVFNSDLVNVSNLKNNQTKIGNQLNIFSDPMNLVQNYSGKYSIFPSEWRSSSIRAKADVANPEDLKSASLEIKNAINKYPSSFLSDQNIKNIHLVGKLSCFGVNYTGTNSRESLYIASTNNKEVEKTFHHELSSILLRNNPDKFDEYKWNSLSRGQSSSSSSAIKNGLDSVELNPGLYDKGFLTNYSMSNPENDFNMLAENIFDGGEQFWNIVDTQPKIADKARIVISFYEKLNPVLSEDYFRALAE